eukprot:2006175-Amphidinium_carterae.1
MKMQRYSGQWARRGVAKPRADFQGVLARAMRPISRSGRLCSQSLPRSFKLGNSSLFQQRPSETDIEAASSADSSSTAPICPAFHPAVTSL